jgi:hypothetical protein
LRGLQDSVPSLGLIGRANVNYEIFDQWLEFGPVEVKYDPKKGRQV